MPPCLHGSKGDTKCSSLSPCHLAALSAHPVLPSKQTGMPRAEGYASRACNGDYARNQLYLLSASCRLCLSKGLMMLEQVARSRLRVPLIKP